MSTSKPKAKTKSEFITLYKVVYYADIMDQPKVRQVQAKCTNGTISIPGEARSLGGTPPRGYYCTPETAKAFYLAKLNQKIAGLRSDIKHIERTLKLGIGRHNF